MIEGIKKDRNSSKGYFGPTGNPFVDAGIKE
jgi:hypothetical protein